MGLFDEKTGGLVVFWKSQVAITSRVGSGINAKIAPDVASELWTTGQFVVYTRGPGGNVFRHLTGCTGGRLSIVHVYCWGDTRADADALAEAVKVTTQNSMARNLYSGNIYVNSVFVDDPPDDGYDKPTDGSAKSKYWTRVVLRIMHSESGGT